MTNSFIEDKWFNWLIAGYEFTKEKNITVVLNGSGHKNLVPLPHKCDLNSQKDK